MSGQLHAPAPLPPWPAQLVPMSSCLSGPESRSRRCEEGKMPTGNRTIIARLFILLVSNQQNDYAISSTVTVSDTFKSPVVSTECTRREMRYVVRCIVFKKNKKVSEINGEKHNKSTSIAV